MHYSDNGGTGRPRVFVNGGAFVRERSPILYGFATLTNVTRHGALSTLGGHSREGPEQQDNSGLIVSFGRTADFKEVSTVSGASLHSQGLRTRRTAMRATSPAGSVWGRFVVSCSMERLRSLAHGHRRQLQIFKEAVHTEEGRATLMGLFRAFRGNGWTL